MLFRSCEGHNHSGLSPMQAQTLTSLLAMEALLVADWAGHEQYTLLGREQRIWLHEHLDPIASGQFDVAYGTLETHRMLIIDGKTLFNEVPPAETNDQLRELVALARHNYPACLEFTVAILQPWVSQKPSIALYDQFEAELALRLLKQTILDAADPDAPRTPGAWCTHCPALTNCEEAKQSLARTSNLAQRIGTGEFALPIGEAGADLLENMELAETALKALRKSYKAILLEDPAAIPGWYMKEGKKVRQISDIQKAYEIASQSADLPLEEFLKSVTVNITALEALVNDVTKFKGRHAADFFNETFGSVINFKQYSPELARESERKGRTKELVQ